MGAIQAVLKWRVERSKATWEGKGVLNPAICSLNASF